MDQLEEFLDKYYTYISEMPVWEKFGIKVSRVGNYIRFDKEHVFSIKYNMPFLVINGVDTIVKMIEAHK